MSNATIGPGQTEVCRRCVLHLKEDVDHKLVDELETLVLPTEIDINGKDVWLFVKDLLKLRCGQRNGRTDAERGDVMFNNGSPCGGA